MDNKFTKKRASNLFAYGWGILVLLMALTLAVFEVFYAFFATRITDGQFFKFYYDYTIGFSDFGYENLYNTFKKANTFSYDILRIEGEEVVDGTNVLRHRLAINEGDFIITDTVLKEDGTNHLRDYVDEFDMYSFEELLNDGVEYLEGFLKDEYLSIDEEIKKQKAYVFENFDVEKIESNFNERMKNDNRYKWDKDAKEKGLEDEKERIAKLCTEMEDFERLIKIGKETGLFYEYTRYEQSSIHSKSEKDRKEYAMLCQKEKENGREKQAFGLKAEALGGGVNKVDPSEFFKLKDSDVSNSENVVIMVFNFLNVQRDLQFETVCAINTIVRTCSDILD